MSENGNTQHNNSNGVKNSVSSNNIIYLGILITSMLILLISVNALIFILIALLPTAAIFFLDRKPHKLLSKTVAGFNLCGIAPYLSYIFASPSNAMQATHNLIYSLQVWFYIYLAAGVGFLVAIGLPQLCGNIFAAKAQIRITQYKQEQKKLAEEWSDEIINPDHPPSG